MVRQILHSADGTGRESMSDKTLALKIKTEGGKPPGWISVGYGSSRTRRQDFARRSQVHPHFGTILKYLS